MMTVNAFWFGFLIAVVLVMVLLITVSFVAARRSEQEEEAMDEQQYKEILEDMTGKKFKVVRKHGYLVGEPVEDHDDDETD